MDGLKVHLNAAEWVHLSPNPDRPHFEIVAEAEDDERARQIVAEYSDLIRCFIEDLNAPHEHRREG
jgi:mannose-1-phosphate guanylyltransferase/phosphomannomutase